MNYEKLGDLNSDLGLEGCFIAGGAVLSRVTKQPIADYDVYPKTRENMFDIFSILLDNNGFVVNLSDRAATFKLNDVYADNGERAIVQVIIGEFTFPRDIFDCFDFTVCMGAYDVDTKKYHFDDRFWVDVAAKDLVFNPGTLYPLNSLIRVNKYKAKGYHISKPQLTKMILTCMDSKFPESWEDLESQIGGTYGRQIKINSDGLEFTKSNIFDVLDSVVEFHDYVAEDYSTYKEAELEFHYSDKSQFRLLELPKGSTPNYLYHKRSVVLKEVEPDVYEVCNMNVETDDLQRVSTGYIQGYKSLVKIDGKLYGSVRQNKSSVTYQPGKAVSIDPADYGGFGLYMAKDKRKFTATYAGLNYLHKALAPIEDIIGINNSEIVTKTIYLGEEIT